MKKNILLLNLIVVATLISAGSRAQFQSASFKWDKTTHDFGEITFKDPVSYEFEFTNSGQAPLVISDVEGSCGCTVTDYSKEPVLPGKKGKIKATFDAATIGKFHKSIKITANVEGGPEYLYIQGSVKN